MESVLVNSIGCIVAIILGYLMRRNGVLKSEDKKTISKLITHVTLPCAIVCGAGNLTIDWRVGILVLLGFLCALLMLLFSHLLTLTVAREEKYFYLLNCGAYNVSCFTIPLIQALVPAEYLIFAFAFDAGNALMATNGAYIATCAIVGQNGEKGSFAKRLFSAIPFDVYIAILIFAVLRVNIPQSVIGVFSIAAKANPFLAMFVVGVMMDLRFDRNSFMKTLRILGIRLGFAIVMCIAVLCLPLDREIERIICVCLFSPISSMAPIFIDMMDGDTSLSSFSFSCSSIASISIIMLILQFT